MINGKGSAARRFRLLMILLSAGISFWWGCFIGWNLSRGPMDFQAVYYGSRTLLLHHNPYSVTDVERTYHAEDALSQSPTPRQFQNMTLYVNTPGTLLFVAPLALLPLRVGQVLWMILSVGGLCLAAFLIWDMAALEGALVAGCLVCFMLLNCQVLFGGGNTAALVIGLCTIAAWCFIEGRFVPAGIVFMAISLLVKPHDSGLIWMYFLIAGGAYRRRALQSAALTAALALAAMLWIWVVAPTWLNDWQSNLAAISGPGGINDPRPVALTAASANNVVSLQAVFSIFTGNPWVYNLASYLVCGSLLCVLIFTTIRTTITRNKILIALAALAPLTTLITYHRVHDTKLLLITIPACAMLWATRGRIGWTALLLTSAAIFVNADIPLAVIGGLTDKLHIATSALTGPVLTVLIARPGQELLLATAVFYLWIYTKRSMETEVVPVVSERN